MFRKWLFNVAVVSAVMMSAATLASAQFDVLGGKIEDEAKKPVAGALVELYNESGKSIRSTTSTKSGGFVFAGVKLGEVFALAISGSGYSPAFQPGVKAGMDKIAIKLTAGDGRKLTAEEVKSALAGGGTAAAGGAPAEPTAEQKKEQADFEAKKKAVEEKNAREKAAYESVVKNLNDGLAADKAGDYDTAIAKFNEGYMADPENPGRAPVLLNNLGLAYEKRGIDRYKKISSTDIQAKIATQNAVKKDFADALIAFDKAFAVANKPLPTGSNADPKILEMNRMASMSTGAETLRYMSQTRLAAPEAFEPAERLIGEYEKTLAEPEKKAATLILIPDMYMAAGESAKAVVGYRKVLAISPDNVDALAGLGLVLFTEGSIASDKAMLQEGADVLAKFVAKAPDTHKYKQDVVAVLTELKNQQIAPTKGAAGTKKKN